MARPVTLFTGQWADLPLEELAAKCAGWGFDGLELACWGDHFDVAEATRDSGYAAGRRELLERHDLGCWAIGNHLVGQAVCDPIDERHKGVLSEEIWGDGDPEGVRQRAAEAMKDTARAAAQLGVDVVTGFTGSPTWHMVYSFPPNDFDAIERGYQEFAERWGPIIDVFEAEGVAVRARGPPDRDRLRLRHDAQGAGGDRRPAGLRHQLRSQPFRAPVPGLGGVHHRVRKQDLPRAHQRLRQASRRPLLDPRRPSELRRAGPRVGLRLARARRRRLRGDDPSAQPNRLQRSPLDRVGGFRDGSRLGSAGRAGIRACDGLRPLLGRVRRSVREGVLNVRGWFRHDGQEHRQVRTSSPSGWACSDTPSWARPTRTRTRRSPT